MAVEPNCEMRCHFCRKKWEGHLKNPPKWKVFYTICSTCYTEIMQEFEKQFPRKLLPKKRLRTEDDGA